MSDSAPRTNRTGPDHVVGSFSRERLSEALSATHRAGFGPYARVFDGERSSTSAQLSRAGLEIAAGPAPAADDLLIVVQAPGRVDRVAELFDQLGAINVAWARRLTAQSSETTDSPLTSPIAIPVTGEASASSGA